MTVYPQRQDGHYWLEIPCEWWQPYAGETGVEIPRWKWWVYLIAARIAYRADKFAQACARRQSY